MEIKDKDLMLTVLVRLMVYLEQWKNDEENPRMKQMYQRFLKEVGKSYNRINKQD